VVVDNGPVDAAGPVAVPPPAAIPEPTVRWEPQAASASTRLVPGTTGLEYAGTVSRAAAYLLDGLFVILISLIPVFIAVLAFSSSLLGNLLALGIQAAYFSLGWRSSTRGTPGMRIFKLQIGRLEDGQPISSDSAIVRWFVLTGWSAAASLLFASAQTVVSGLVLLWVLILLVSAQSDPRRQGLHDKLTHTAIVRPVGQSDTGAWVALILALVVPVVLALFAIVALIFLGAQVSHILSTVGQSVGQ
jgi:uncharacterized RDD family membrane protein YckC